MPKYIAIGDIHGLLHPLNDLLGLLPDTGTLVFLGDYIDRGPESKEVIERLLALRQARECVFLRGNHEQMALDALDDFEERQNWFCNGGLETMRSYNDSGGIILPAHLDFMRETPFSHEAEEYIFVHAGMKPGLAPAENDKMDLIWIREKFLRSSYDWGKKVIHGHSPTFELDFTPEARPNRINIDTGSCFGGQLTAVLLPEEKFLSVDGEVCHW